MDEECIFCREYRTKYDHINNQELPILYENSSFWIKPDPNPVSPEHYLIISKRHDNSMANLTPLQRHDFFDALEIVVREVCKTTEYYNIGVNKGEPAGQTIHHLHIHVIGRHEGDVPNPRGGVRNIIPEKGDYKK